MNKPASLYYSFLHNKILKISYKYFYLLNINFIFMKYLNIQTHFARLFYPIPLINFRYHKKIFFLLISCIKFFASFSYPDVKEFAAKYKQVYYGVMAM